MQATEVISIHQLLSTDTICVGLDGTTKAEVVGKLVDLLEGHPQVMDLEVIRERVFAREALMSTGVGKALGLPHAKTAAVKQTVAAFATTAQPIAYDAIDEEPVRLLFLLVGTEHAKSHHIKILSRVSLLMNREPFRAALLQATDPASILHLFAKAEATLSDH